MKDQSMETKTSLSGSLDLSFSIVCSKANESCLLGLNFIFPPRKA